MVKVEKNILIKIFTSCVILFFGYCTLSTPTRHGDGHEYAIVTQAFLCHFSPNIRIADIEQREKEIETYPNNGYGQTMFPSIKNVIMQKEESNNYSVYRAKNEQYYGPHFWLYPAYVAVIEKILIFIGANPLASFQFANAIMFLAVIGFCLFYGSICFERRMTLVAAFVFGGTLFYLNWTHPEVFIASLLFLGFITIFQGTFYIFFPCVALASLQVISIYPVFLAVPLLLLLQTNVIFNDQLKSLGKSLWVWLFLALPLCSFCFYYINYGKLNLIGTEFSDIRLISFSHLYSFWFDLDQGVFVGAPWLLVILIFFIYRVKRISRECKLAFFVSVFASVCICIPLLANVDVNSGQSVFHRHALYAISPLIAWAGFYLVDIITTEWLRVAIFIGAASYAVPFMLGNGREDYLEHKYWTKLILEKFPRYYNPEPGVFYARTFGRGDIWWHTNKNHALIYKDKEGVIRKILFPINKAHQAISEICIGQLVGKDGLPIDYSTKKHGTYGWAYLNGHFYCKNIDLTKLD